MKITYVSMNRTTKQKSEDNFVVVDKKNFVFADGAGGVGNGYEASAKVIELLSKDINMDLDILDYEVNKTLGMSTLIIAKIDGEYIKGFSIGDSEFLFFDEENKVDNLTISQIKKPMLGDGGFPIPFHLKTKNGIGIIASDGLWKYSKLDDIKNIVFNNFDNIDTIINLLDENVKLSENDYWDDTGVIVFKIENN